MAKQRAFIMKYQYFYTSYNHGKSHRSRKRNRILGNKKMRRNLNNELLILRSELDGEGKES